MVLFDMCWGRTGLVDPVSRGLFLHVFVSCKEYRCQKEFQEEGDESRGYCLWLEDRVKLQLYTKTFYGAFTNSCVWHGVLVRPGLPSYVIHASSTAVGIIRLVLNSVLSEHISCIFSCYSIRRFYNIPGCPVCSVSGRCRPSSDAVVCLSVSPAFTVMSEVGNCRKSPFGASRSCFRAVIITRERDDKLSADGTEENRRTMDRTSPFVTHVQDKWHQALLCGSSTPIYGALLGWSSLCQRYRPRNQVLITEVVENVDV